MDGQWDENRKEVPFDPFTGDMMRYPQEVYKRGETPRGPEWREAVPFVDTLRFVRMYSGRSAKGLILESVSTGVRYSMFTKDAVEMLMTLKPEHLTGTNEYTCAWGFVKRGANFGIFMSHDGEVLRPVHERIQGFVRAICANAGLNVQPRDIRVLSVPGGTRAHPTNVTRNAFVAIVKEYYTDEWSIISPEIEVLNGVPHISGAYGDSGRRWKLTQSRLEAGSVEFELPLDLATAIDEVRKRNGQSAS
jgi:hypothetical protein